MYQNKIDIIVQSKYPEILKEFLDGFKPTTEKFTNLKLHILDGAEFGAKAINKILIDVFQKTDFFGVFNDDLWFVDGWLEDCLRLLETHECVSAGYVNTYSHEAFEKAVEATKNETGVAKHLFGSNPIFRTSVFKKIGIYDERFDFSCDDLDWSWRFKLNGMSSVTSKKITMAHNIGRTRVRNAKAWNILSDRNKQRFYDKHGYVAYREIRREYKDNHQYFVQFKDV
jgi:hypothetical protein